MATNLRESLEMIRDDAEADSHKGVDFTPLGLGTVYGEQLAMIQALAKTCLALLNAVEDLEERLDRRKL